MTARKIVECVPNFSEGRDPDVVDRIVAAITGVPGAFLLDRTMDAAHHRSVITFAGEPESVLEAAVAAVGRAAEWIDLRTHRGEHPRIGAADVVPFVPIAGVTMADCVALAERAGREIWERYRIPVYLYEEAARTPERRNLAAVRRGEFEGLSREVEANPRRRPDFGEAHLHPTAGATAVGARFPLIAYNIYLNTNDGTVAKQIAKAIRHSSGGLPHVKALGFAIRERNQAQVSMNLTRFEETPIPRVFEMVKREAERRGAAIASSEIVGLIPQKALNSCAESYLQLERFSEDQILENRLMTMRSGPARESTLSEFVDRVAACGGAPGGGRVAALAGSLGAAIGFMVCGLTPDNESAIPTERPVCAIAGALENLKSRLYELVNEDARTYEAVAAASARPQATDTEAQARKARIEAGLKQAVEVPLQTARAGLEVLQWLERLRPIGHSPALSDLGVGAAMAHASVKGAAYNVCVNLAAIADPIFRDEYRAAIDRIVEEAERTAKNIERSLVF